MLQARLDILYMRDTEATMETSEPIMALPAIDTSVGVPLFARDSIPRLPEISQIALENSRAEWHTYNESCPSPNIPTRCEPVSRTHMPQFRQSRRWARMYAWSRAEMETAPTPLDARNLPSTGYLCSSDAGNDQHMGRPISLQQHRGLPKAMAKTFGRPKNRRNISEASAGSHPGGLCAQGAAYYWRCVKPLISKVPRASSRVWPNRLPRKRKVTTTRHQDARGRRPSALIFVPAHLRKDSNMETDDDKSRCESGLTLANGGLRSCLNGCSHVGNDPAGCTGLAASPMPSLDDAIATGRFSDECRNVLKTENFDNDRLLPTTSSVPAVVMRSSARKYASQEFTQLSKETARRQVLSAAMSKPLPPSPPRMETRTPVPNNTPTAPLSAHPPRSPELAVQAPGHGISSLDTMLYAAPTQPLPVTSSSGAFRQMNRPLQHQSNIKTPQPRASMPVMRLSSARSAKSANTLAGIEAQVQRMSHYSIDVELRRTGSTDSGTRNSGPPPNIPLPALPPEAHDAQLAVAKTPDELARLEGGLEDNLQICLHFVRHVIRTTRADKVREKRMRDLAKSRNLLGKTDSSGTNDIRKKSSFSRITHTVTYHSDELDQFPAVPDSRPASLCSRTASCYSRQHSPELRIRQQRSMSKVQSTETQRTMPPQKLSQSNIFVVVDADPVTARFRAGAVSPRLSIAGSTTSVASGKAARTPSKLKEVMANRLSLYESPRRDNVLGSPMESPIRKVAGISPTGERDVKLRRSHSCSSQLQIKPPGRIDSPAPSTSSDEHWLTPGKKISPIKPTSQQRKRRRWNSGDINLVKQLHQDLRDYYVTILEQEEKIKWQATQIQTMMKIFAPMKQIQGLEESVYLQDSPPRDTHSSHRQIRKCRSALTERRPPSSSSHSRFPLDSINEQTLNSQSHRIAMKGEETSTAPSSDTMSLASIKASASDTSLTEQEKIAIPIGKHDAELETWGWI